MKLFVGSSLSHLGRESKNMYSNQMQKRNGMQTTWVVGAAATSTLAPSPLALESFGATLLHQRLLRSDCQEAYLHGSHVELQASA